jgi:2'-5' RNA ligase
VRPENLHLTLCFLGDVSADQIQRVEADLGRSVGEIPAFTLTPKGIGCFPNVRRPSVVWVGLSGGSAELERLSKAAGMAAKSAGIALDKKPFVPHVTLGRVRDRRAVGTLPEHVARHEAFEAAPFRATEITLYESVLGHHGARYNALAHFPLRETRYGDASPDVPVSS